MNNVGNPLVRERALGHARDFVDGFMVSPVVPAPHQHADGPGLCCPSGMRRLE